MIAVGGIYLDIAVCWQYVGGMLAVCWQYFGSKLSQRWE